MSLSVDRSKPGLRERKKAKTRATIQHEALALIRKQGYAATTVEQICDAAEVSESTFFRYFPAKEDVVLSDEFDPLIAAAFRAQPADVGIVQAMRQAIRSVSKTLLPEELADLRERSVMAWQIPELRAASLIQLTDTIHLVAELTAERTRRKADNPEVRAFAGALIGVMISQMSTWAEHPHIDVLVSIDDALAFLESGLPIDDET